MKPLNLNVKKRKFVYPTDLMYQTPNCFYVSLCVSPPPPPLTLTCLADHFRVLLKGETPDYIHAVFAHVRHPYLNNSLLA